MEPGQEAKDKNEIIAHVLTDVGRPTPADNFGIEEYDEENSDKPQDKASELPEPIARGFGRIP